MGHEPHYHPFPLGAGIYARTSYLFDGIVIPLQYHIDGKLLQIICEKTHCNHTRPLSTFSVMDSFVWATPSFASLDMAHLPWNTAEDY